MTFKELFLEKLNIEVKKGAFHKWAMEKGFIKSMDDEIPCKAICAGLADEDPHVRKMANFARNFGKKIHGEDCKCGMKENLDEAAKKNVYIGKESDGKMCLALGIDGWNVNVKDSVKRGFGGMIDLRPEMQRIKQNGKKVYVDAKGKATIKAVKDYVKEHKPKEFYARWKCDSSFYKDDNVEMYVID